LAFVAALDVEHIDHDRMRDRWASKYQGTRQRGPIDG
jgi:hypothetical protein